MKSLGLLATALALFGAGFFLGRVSLPNTTLEARETKSPYAVLMVQQAPNAAQSAPNAAQSAPNAAQSAPNAAQSAPNAAQSAPNDPRELIPLGPNGQQPGQGQQPQPGQGQAPADCPVQIYQDGQLFTFPRPGQQPGQGQGNQPNQPGGAQELIPLNPSAPSSPSTPNTPSSPSTPNTPTNPRS
jgi:hypothetical protein